MIREARRRSGLPQAELARRAHVSQPVISAYESGRREPGLSMLTKLVEASGHRLQLDLLPAPQFPRTLPDTPKGRLLRRHRQGILNAAQQRRATNVRVFGSVARGEDTDTSDIDFLVDLNADVGLLGLIGLESDVAELLGRSVVLYHRPKRRRGLAWARPLLSCCFVGGGGRI